MHQNLKEYFASETSPGPLNTRALETPGVESASWRVGPSRLYAAAGRALPVRCSSGWNPLRGELGRDIAFGGDGVEGLPGRRRQRRDHPFHRAPNIELFRVGQELPARRIRHRRDLASGP